VEEAAVEKAVEEGAQDQLDLPIKCLSHKLEM